jgi:hypothetical protein
MGILLRGIQLNRLAILACGPVTADLNRNTNAAASNNLGVGDEAGLAVCSTCDTSGVLRRDLDSDNSGWRVRVVELAGPTLPYVIDLNLTSYFRLQCVSINYNQFTRVTSIRCFWYLLLVPEAQ